MNPINVRVDLRLIKLRDPPAARFYRCSTLRTLYMTGQGEHQHRNASIYEDRVGPPIGGLALHNTCAKGRGYKRRRSIGPYQEVEVLHVFETYIYILIIFFEETGIWPGAFFVSA